MKLVESFAHARFLKNVCSVSYIGRESTFFKSQASIPPSEAGQKRSDHSPNKNWGCAQLQQLIGYATKAVRGEDMEPPRRPRNTLCSPKGSLFEGIPERIAFWALEVH